MYFELYATNDRQKKVKVDNNITYFKWFDTFFSSILGLNL